MNFISSHIKNKLLLYSITLLFLGNILYGQQNHSIQNFYKDEFSSNEMNTCFSPFESSMMLSDTSIINQFYPGRRMIDEKNWFVRKLFFERFISLNQEDVKLTIDPVVNIQLGRQDLGTEKVYRNSRGFLVNGKLGEKIFFYFIF